MCCWKRENENEDFRKSQNLKNHRLKPVNFLGFLFCYMRFDTPRTIVQGFEPDFRDYGENKVAHECHHIEYVNVSGDAKETRITK